MIEQVETVDQHHHRQQNGCSHAFQSLSERHWLLETLSYIRDTSSRWKRGHVSWLRGLPWWLEIYTHPRDEKTRPRTRRRRVSASGRWDRRSSSRTRLAGSPGRQRRRQRQARDGRGVARAPCGRSAGWRAPRCRGGPAVAGTALCDGRTKGAGAPTRRGRRAAWSWDSLTWTSPSHSAKKRRSRCVDSLQLPLPVWPAQQSLQWRWQRLVLEASSLPHKQRNRYKSMFSSSLACQYDTPAFSCWTLCCCAVDAGCSLSIDISCPRGAQQQTRRSCCRMMGQTVSKTDGHSTVS